MPAPSEPVSFKKYGVDRRCYGCNRPLLLADARWWTGYPRRAVYGQCCFLKGAQP